MTTVAILQPGYLPWLGFFDQVRRADRFVYYDDVPFDKHGWRNRNRVKGPDGPVWLTVPVRHKGRSGQLIHQVEIQGELPWARKQMATLRQLYARAPHAEPCLGELEAVLNRPWRLLVELDLAVIGLMCDWLGLVTPRLRSSELGITGGRSERLLAICRSLGATTYLSGDAARDYLDLELFARHRIRVEWQGYRHPVHPQLHGPFVSHLSALDPVLNLGGAAAARLIGATGEEGNGGGGSGPGAGRNHEMGAG